MFTLKLVAFGEEVAAILPPALLARLQLGVGDSLFVVESPGGFVLTSHDPVFAHQTNTAASIMKRRQQALRVLCK